MSNLHQESLIIDGLIISKWDRSVFEDMKKAGLAAANCTVSVWEDFAGTVKNISAMKKMIRDNSDLITLVRSTADIEQAKKDGKTGIILGFQNAHAFEDQLGHIEAFHDMGVRVVQLCYNTQNLIGTGCYERDGGLSGYAVTDRRHTYFRWFGGRLELLDADAPDAALEDAAFQFVDEWIWYDEEEAALERVRYANYGYPVRGANVKSEKLALLRAQGGAYSTLDEQGRAARAAVVEQWLNK